MFTNNLNLPIDSDRAMQSDQTLSLAGMTWVDYEKFDSEDYSGYLVSYFNGVISIVSPGRNHENIGQTFIVLINAYCRHYNLIYYPMGSTRLKNPPLAGKEPDVSYAFAIDKTIPDLAIEVVFSSGGIIELEKYRLLGVKEVWFWQNREIKIFQLIGDRYQEVSVSNCLPQLNSKSLAEFVNRGLSETPLSIEADFIAQLPIS
ncbi:conserved hypothetical protein [Hyella patelloides LEGE 07179]|uniref:Putative restriction endonuclease domain-containing protein n=1 Tax=Hyella patelloides LEGE 07179 TaxID=945734 RepID=A0A563VJF6_9CYAN|nr:Uma2 family endonuclease [Hyella patelloides]VEP11590.1 conserved hypothetical protein [Hyella patelloides LEGE 07179]